MKKFVRVVTLALLMVSVDLTAVSVLYARQPVDCNQKCMPYKGGSGYNACMIGCEYGNGGF